MIQKRPKRKPNGVSRDLRPIELPPPVLKPSSSLARALKLRRTLREISDKKLPLQTLSESSLGRLRSEPQARSLRDPRKDRGIGQQLPGD
jgi:hypothetical protein